VFTASNARRVALILAGAWAAFNGFVYTADASKRYRAEAAWFIFSAVLIVAALHALARGARQTSPDYPVPTFRLSAIAFLCLLVLAAALYFPMLSIGLLSDDFVLLGRAQAGALADPAWDYLRPLPLAIWTVLSGFGGSAVLHFFNIGLHGANAYLTGIVATRFGLSLRSALVAAIVFLVLPSSVEAVAWASGVFDVLLVTLTLTACIALTTISESLPRTILIVLLTAGALLTKETAVILPALLAIAAWCSPRSTMRRAAVPIACSAGVVVLYLVIRVLAGFASSPPSEHLSGYALKEIVSRPFGTLALPFHIEFLKSHPWIPFVFAAYWPALFVWSAVRWPNARKDAGQLLALAAWIVISIMPLATMLFISEDLQGARYLYLGSVAWSIILAGLLRSIREPQRMWVLIPVIAVFVIATRAHQSPWTAAADERKRVLATYRQSEMRCIPEKVRGLPDNVKGAYVFRNGFAEAIAASTPSAESTAPCVLNWDGTRFSRGDAR
jgi:hypothetical protein